IRMLREELGRGDYHLHAVRLEEVLFLLGDLVGDGADDAVAAHRPHDRQAYAGVAGGRLDNGAPGAEKPVLFRLLDHRDGDPVLDRAARIEHLHLGHEVPRWVEPGEADEGSAADQIYHGVMDHGANDKSPVRSMGKTPGPVPRLSLPGGRSVISQGHAPPVTDPLRMV